MSVDRKSLFLIRVRRMHCLGASGAAANGRAHVFGGLHRQALRRSNEDCQCRNCDRVREGGASRLVCPLNADRRCQRHSAGPKDASKYNHLSNVPKPLSRISLVGIPQEEGQQRGTLPRKSRSKLREVTSAIASTDNDLISASCRPTHGTSAGLLTLPRKGIGARYGLSVSIRQRSRGTKAATSRSATALLKVRMPEKEM